MIDADSARRELARMHECLPYFTEAECRRADQLIDIINEASMATRVKGTVKDGKFKPKDSTPAPLRKGKALKAARVEKGLKANRARSKAT